MKDQNESVEDRDQKAYAALERLLRQVRSEHKTGEGAVKVVARDGGLMDVRTITDFRE